jgi:hypothetical protein
MIAKNVSSVFVIYFILVNFVCTKHFHSNLIFKGKDPPWVGSTIIQKP